MDKFMINIRADQKQRVVTITQELAANQLPSKGYMDAKYMHGGNPVYVIAETDDWMVFTGCAPAPAEIKIVDGDRIKEFRTNLRRLPDKIVARRWA
jgi:hypothetical protein